MPAAIETQELTKDFLVGFWRPRPYRALDGLTLSIEAGEVFGFLGPNGAGKSTTLKLLLQLIYPTNGTARILGKPAGEVEVRRRIGYLPENPYFYDDLTAEEVLSYFASLFGLRGADVARRVSTVLDDVGIAAERRMRLRGFSKGMLQRVGLAQAILNEPDVLFLDEPMSGLDPIGRRQVRDLILSLRQRGCTVFFSSHILPDAEALCSRVAIVVQGRLVANGAVSEIAEFQLTGWELVAADVNESLRSSIAGRARKVTSIGAGRFVIDLPPEVGPDRVLAELAAGGAHIVSLNPHRETLEDYFIRQVSAAAPRQTGID
ncbi:MAG: ABC transporter ATP-binding protein [Acidimicrobiia bacterium]|nr:ABC transporter ATP-binding protein [Acidimicrobiia bacterium]